MSAQITIGGVTYTIPTQDGEQFYPAMSDVIQAIATSEGGGALVASKATATDASANLVSSTTTSAELAFVHGVTSAIQTQITSVVNSDALKAPLASPTFTGTVVLPSTTSIGTVSSTEIGYVDGVTSTIQGQIDAKAPLASPTFTGTVNAAAIISSGNISAKQESVTVQTLTSGATINWDLNSGSAAKVTLNTGVGTQNVANPTNMVAGTYPTILFTQDGTGLVVVTWDAAFKFTAGTPPVITVTANKSSLVTFFCDGTTMWYQSSTLNL